MPVPKATGTHGNSRPAPASARAQLRKVSMKGDKAESPDGASGPACTAPRGGQVPAIPCVRPLPLPGSAIPHLNDRSLQWMVRGRRTGKKHVVWVVLGAEGVGRDRQSRDRLLDRLDHADLFQV